MTTSITTFDVLVIYTEKLAISANSPLEGTPAPFAKESANANYNIVYAYFLKTCRRFNLKAAFATSADIIGAGLVKSYWLFDNGTWLKRDKVGFSELIFDKFFPTSKKIRVSRNLLFSSKKVKSFSNPHLFNLCFDKQKTYNKLRKFSIPTVTIKGATRKGVTEAYKTLTEKVAIHPHKDDFSDEIIMKDRFGAGGNNVYKFKASQRLKMIAVMKKHKKKSFIAQPFVKFNKGFSYKNSPVSTDIRMIYFGKKIVQTYIRMAKPEEFRCNEHQGGLLKYLPVREMPPKVVAFSNDIAKILNERSSFFTLDFIISNTRNVYLLEANTGPGLDWNLKIKENEIEAKKLIRLVVKELAKRVKLPITTSKNKVENIKVGVPGASEYTVVPNLLSPL